MFAQKSRAAVIVMTLMTVPASHADACEFLRRCFGGSKTTYYAPPAPCAPTCCPQPQPCCPQPTVSYMPQTCYRTVYTNVPVVAYRPMTSCDPCTGCARTVMQPVTSYVAQPRLVAYTAYRPVVTANYAPQCATGCGAAPTTVAYPAMPAMYAAPAAPAAPSCCGSGGAAAYAPSVTNVAPAPPYAAAPGYTAAPTAAPSLAPQAGPAPSLAPPADAPATGTFESTRPITPVEPQPESRTIQPLELGPSTSLGTPRARPRIPGPDDRAAPERHAGRPPGVGEDRDRGRASGRRLAC